MNKKNYVRRGGVVKDTHIFTRKDGRRDSSPEGRPGGVYDLKKSGGRGAILVKIRLHARGGTYLTEEEIKKWE